MDKTVKGTNTLTTDELVAITHHAQLDPICSWLDSWGITPSGYEAGEMALVRAMCELRSLTDQLTQFDTDWVNKDQFGKDVKNNLDRALWSMRDALAEKVYLRIEHEEREEDKATERCLSHASDQTVTGHCTSANCRTYAQEMGVPYEGPEA